jgi:hypothetical protein
MSDGLNTTSIQQGYGAVGYTPSPLVQQVQPFLGLPPKENLQLDAYQRTSRTNENLHDLYRGQNLYLRNTISNILFGDDDWYFMVCPWAYTPQNSVVWNVWKFDHAYADRVPPEGISRLVTSHRESYSGNLVRRGLAFKLEVDFYNTDEGVDQWYRNCEQIAQSVLDTQSQDTLMELLSCKDMQRKWHELFTKLPTSYITILQDEVDQYAATQKDEKKIYNIFYKMQRNMQSNKEGTGAGDTLITPPESKIYLNLVGPTKTAYYVEGPDGPLIKKRGPDAVGLFDGSVQVFETRDFHNSEQGSYMNLLTRAIAIGEYYMMSLAEYRGMNFRFYSSRWRDIYLYDENFDEFKKVTFEDAFRYSRIFADDGSPSNRLVEYLDKIKGFNRKNDPFRSSGLKETDDAPATRDIDMSFPLFTTDRDGKVDIATHFGQINMRAATSQDFKNMAQSIIGKLQTENGIDDVKAYHDMIDLITNIENESYNHQYWVDLISENLARSSAADFSEFVGESVPNDIRTRWGIVDLIKEWTPNAYGSLNLPRKSKYNCYPAGFANVPGFRTLAAELTCDDSPWAGVAMRATSAMNLLDKIVNALKSSIPSCELINPKNRAPWFHKDDAATVIFQLIANRDPIFMAALAPAKGIGSGGLAVNMETEGNDLPVEVQDLYSSSSEGYDSTADLTINLNGVPIIIKADMLKAKLTSLARGIAIETYLGKSLSSKYNDIIKNLDNVKAAYLTSTLITFIHSGGKEGRMKAGLFIVNLNALPDNARKAKIDILTSSKASREKKTTVMEELLNDKDLSGLVLLPDLTSAPEKSKEIRSNLESPSSYTNYEAFEALIAAWKDARLELNETKLDLNNLATYEASSNASLSKAAKEYIEALKKDGYDTSSKRNMNELNAQADALYKPAKPATIPVKSTLQDVANSEFFRTPLTMSLPLLKTLAMHPFPVILPSNHLMAHLDAYRFPRQKGVKPSVDPTIYQRPQYATVTALTEKGSPHIDLKILGPIASTFGTKKTNAVIGAHNTGKNKRVPLDEESHNKRYGLTDDDPFDDGDNSMKPNYTRKNNGKSFRDEEMADVDADWSLRDLEERGTRQSDKHAPFEDGVFGDMRMKAHNPVMAARHKQIFDDLSGDPVVRLVALASLWTRNNGRDWLLAIRNDVCVPINFIIWRPNITHDMSTYILMRAGLETGANFYGHTNFMFSSDVSSKVLLGHYTLQTKCIVYNSANVRLLENVKSEKYRGGNNTKFAVLKDFNSEDINRGSMISTAIPVTEESPPQQAISFTGFFPFAGYNERIDGVQVPHYSTYLYYDKEIWKFGEKILSRNPGRERYMDQTAFGGRVNVVCLPGLQANFNTASGIYNKWKECKGHRGRNGSYPGCAETWNGKYSWFKEVNFSNYILE